MRMMGNYIVVYTADECNWCDNIINILRRERPTSTIETRNINTNKIYHDDFKEHGFRSVPQVFMDGRHVGGHDSTVSYLKLQVE